MLLAVFFAFSSVIFTVTAQYQQCNTIQYGIPYGTPNTNYGTFVPCCGGCSATIPILSVKPCSSVHSIRVKACDYMGKPVIIPDTLWLDATVTIPGSCPQNNGYYTVEYFCNSYA